MKKAEVRILIQSDETDLERGAKGDAQLLKNACGAVNRLSLSASIADDYCNNARQVKTL